jgi:NTE family protein
MRWEPRSVRAPPATPQCSGVYGWQVESLKARQEFLRRVQIFAGLPAETLEEIAAHADVVEVTAGDWLVREGEPAEGLYVLRSGRLEVVREAGDAETVVRVMAPGAVIGELALLTGAKRAASVRARRDCALLSVSSEAFRRLLYGNPEFAIALTRTLATQLQASRPVVLPRDPVPRVIAVVPLSERVNAPALADELAATLSRSHEVALIGAQEVGTRESFGAALDEWEQASDQVVLVAEPADDRWRAFCLRQADRVVAVADGRPPPALAAARLAGCDLAVLDQRDARETLAHCIEALDPRAVHLVGGHSSGRDDSVEMLARRLAGRSPAVVLSGGGARGLAHIGVLDELLGAGIAIDRVGGCSMGALVGALFATGLGPDEIEERLREELVDGSPMSDYTVPLAALVRGRKAEAMLLRLFGDLRIEELSREFFCVSCDLVSSSLVVHRRGPLYEAVGASICLPGIAPPVADGERLLVDGGVLDNLPVREMAGRGEGPVVAVDVSSRFEPPSRRAGGAGRPRLTRLSARLRTAVIGWETPLPSFRETLMRTIVLGSIDTAEAAQQHANLVIAPAVQGVGLVDFGRIDEVRAQGAVAARAVLDGLPSGILQGLVGR